MTARHGLAPLELVLTLPVLLCVMALMINFAHASMWKVKSATAARLAMWRHRPLWNGDNDPKPANYWPATAAMPVVGTSRISEVDQVWNQPAIAQGWIKGPVFSVGNGYLAVRDNRVNEMAEGVSQGQGNVDIRYPFLPSMGLLRMRADNTLLDNLWQFHTMGSGQNTYRRAKNWWQLEDSPDWSALKQLYLQADSNILHNRLASYLRPLDRDPDLRARRYPYDFYPTEYRRDDNVALWQQEIRRPRGLLEQIRGRGMGAGGVCARMASSYLRMYQDELSRIENDPNQATRVAQLKTWIQQLEDFLTALGGP